MTSRFLHVLVLALTILLCSCVDETHDSTAITEAEIAATTADVEVGGACDNGDAAIKSPLELNLVTALPSCPSGSTRKCNPSGECYCCWNKGRFGTQCCYYTRPYALCNQSGECRCSATP